MGFIYKARHQRQIIAGDKYGKYNCAAYSLAMAIDRATMGGTLVTGKQVRAASNEPTPDPDSPGLGISQLIAVAFQWHVEITDRRHAPWSALIDALKEQRGVILFGDYDAIPPPWSCQVSFDGPHSIWLNHITGDGDLYKNDPLCPGPNANFPEKVARAYAEKLAKAWGTYPGLQFATTRITPTIAVAQ